MKIIKDSQTRRSFYGSLADKVHKGFIGKYGIPTILKDFEEKLIDVKCYKYIGLDGEIIITEEELQEIIQYHLRKKYINAGNMQAFYYRLDYGESKDKQITEVAYEYFNGLKGIDDIAHDHEKKFYYKCKSLEESLDMEEGD